MAKTTEEHYELFILECNRLVKLWGLMDWKIYFEHEENKGNRAQIWVDGDNHTATIQLSGSWQDNNPTEQGILHAARHEMIHLLIGYFNHCAESRYCTMSEMRAERERLVRHLYFILFDDIPMWEVLPTDREAMTIKKRRKDD